MSEDPRLVEAEQLLASGSVGRAAAAAEAVIAEQPGLGRAHHLLGQALEARGDRPGAESAYRRSLMLNPNSRTATRLAQLLIQRRRPDEAGTFLAPFADSPEADVSLLTALGQAYKAQNRFEEAVDAYRRAEAAAPNSAAATHNLAGAYGDGHRFAESAEAADRALAMGLGAPEAYVVRGRALIGLGDYDGGEAALREAIARRPGYADAHAELAQLIWRRTEDIDAAGAELDAALRQFPAEPSLSLAKAKLLEYAGELEGAYAALEPALALRGSDPRLQIDAALVSLAVDADRALAHAQRAYDLAPDIGPTGAALCQANLAIGRADIAANLAADLRGDWPADQFPVTLLATAWRILGDPRYLDLADYDRLVRQTVIETPADWPDLEAFLRDLAGALHALQDLKGHPVGQSLRKGSQTTQNLALSDHPVIRAFFAAIDAPIRDYIRVLAERDDVLGARVGQGYRFAGAWSALLRPGGHHVNHIHPMGWISSAFHVETPQAIEVGRQGWLKFGEPAVPTTPVLAPEHFIKPRAGSLVLFPSYMWHGTVPFGGDTPRLSIAFDVLPG